MLRTSDSTMDRMVLGSYVPTPLARAVSKLAARNDRSVSGEIRVAIRNHVAAAEAPVTRQPAGEN
jgi:hypothetical protein